MSKEKLQPNIVPSTLFVGVGGIGSKIISKVADLSRDDDMQRARFVILDTDINDLRLNDGNIRVSAIQTSSTRTIRDYLLQDEEARTEWFPNNMIINNKNVSEGAGQIRAISRLALNATIRTGRINKLYKAIDELYLKDGSDKKQTIKVIIASTVAGGTGSGIAMIVGMLIRNYIKKNYPESCAVIRGFLLMPGVMEALPDLSYTEKRSLQRNGYATIREINAFMMRPFFGAVPELRRYKNLHIAVPTTGNQHEKLDCLPFDFCFLFDRADENEFNMNSLEQYRAYVAHAIYEQNIGSLSRSAASKEDNVLKEFLNEEKLGRSRFGGAGAAVVKYPYEMIRDYIAYEWLEKTIMGYSSDEVSDEKAREEMMAESWLAYDRKYQEKKKAYENGGDASLEEPVLSVIYTTSIENGTDEFSKELKKKHIDIKNGRYDGGNAVENYITELIQQASLLYSRQRNTDMYGTLAKYATPTGSDCTARYNGINSIANFVNCTDIKAVAASLAESIFNNNEIMKRGLEGFKIESFLSLDGTAMHPNAMRYFLYKLLDALNEKTIKEPTQGQCDQAFNAHRNGETAVDGGTKPDPKKFKVAAHLGEETNLFSMCAAVDDPVSEFLVSNAKATCEEYLTDFCSSVKAQYTKILSFHICNEVKGYVSRLIDAFESFYASFGSKMVGVQKRKSTIAGKLAFHNGDCVYNVFNNPNYLKVLVRTFEKPSGESKHTSDLNAGIYNAVKQNAIIGERRKNDIFSKDTLADVFDTVIVTQFRNMVSEKCDDALDVDILRGIALEFKMKCAYDAEQVSDESEKERLMAYANDYEQLNAYVLSTIGIGKNLACPSITRKTFDESREVSAIGFSSKLAPKEGIVIPHEFDGKNASDSISVRELHFFRSIYDVMPTQIQKLCAPDAPIDEMDADITTDDITSGGAVGEYFIAYQEYMQKIGPDNRLNPVITPHVDKRWNSISVLPELDPRGYQRRLMKSIHEAFVYGFIYGIIDKHSQSVYDPNKFVYRYKDGENGIKEFIVSNHTKCDRLFEVLDSLYFDRYAVKSISTAADDVRSLEYQRSTAYERTTFVSCVDNLNRTQLIDDLARVEEAKKYADKPASIFEIVLFYWNSLPKKDASEIEIMVEAIFDIITKEISTFADDKNINPLIAIKLVKHCNLLQENYKLFPNLFAGDNAVSVESNDVILTIRKMVQAKIAKLDVSDSPDFTIAQL